MKKIKIYQCGWEDPVCNEYPLSIGYLKTNCRADIELVRDSKNLKNCDYIGLSSNAWGIQEAIHILKEIKNIPIIIGGQGTLWDDLEKFPFKHIVKGEGESALNYIIKNNPTEKIIQLPNIKDIDSLKYPERGRCTDTIPIFTSRGCPFSCNYCSSRVFWNGVRFHSAKYFIDEVDFLIKKYPQIKTLYIYDDLFIAHKKRFDEIFEIWMQKGWNKRLKLKSFVRAGVFTLEIGKKMKEMGFYEVRFGAESGSDKVLKLINKGNTVEDNQKTIDIARSIGLPVRASFMHHIPGETDEDRQMTLDFIKRNNLSVQGWYKFEPFPGTKFYVNTDLSKRGMTNRDIKYRKKDVKEAWDNGKQDISHDVTVFVIAIEKGKNYKACLEALANQTVDFKLDIIEDYTPMSEAFNQMLQRCTTPFLIQCDEDMILKPDAVNYMHTIMLKNKSDVGTILFALHDVFEDRKIRGIRINRTEILKKYPFQNLLSCENNQKLAMANDGYVTKTDGMIMGEHSPYWTNYTIFQRYYNMIERSKFYPGKYPKVPYELWKILEKNPNKLNLYALLGAISSLITKENPNQEKNYIKDYYNPVFQKIQNKLEINKNIEFISPEINHVYIKALSKHLNIELEKDLNKVRKSNKALILWNGYGYVKIPNHKWKIDLINEFKNSGKLAYILERGALPETVCLDMNGFLYFSSSYDMKNWNFKLTNTEKKDIESYIKSFKNDISSLEAQKNGFVSKNKFYSELNLKPNTIKVFVALQVHNDTTVLLWCDWVKSMQNFQDIITKLGSKMKNVEFLVKNNPVERELMTESENVKIVDNYHYKDCIKYSDVILTVNSSIGLQAMMWKKPVITVGNSFYHFPKINRNAKNIKEIKKFIYHPKKPDMKLVKRFLHYLKNKLYIDCTMKPISRGSSYMDKVKQIRFQTPNGWANFPVIDYDIKDAEIIKPNEKIEEKNEKIFKDVIETLNNKNVEYYILYYSCLDCIKYKILKKEPNNLYLGGDIEKINSILIEKGFKKQEKTYTYENLNIIIEETKCKETKIMNLFDTPVNVPYPVVKYLVNTFGDDWRNNE